jgi:hypothetical protein
MAMIATANIVRPRAGACRVSAGLGTGAGEQRLQRHQQREQPGAGADHEVERVGGVREGLEADDRAPGRQRRGDDHIECERQHREGLAEARQAPAPARRVAPDEEPRRQVRVPARRLAHRERHVEREQPLRDVVRLSRPGAEQVAQRPLREQQQGKRQHQPGTERGRAIEHAGAARSQPP